MRPESSHNPARYHWAAFGHPLHLGGAALGWLAVTGLGIGSMMGLLSSDPAGWMALLSMLWSGIWLLGLPGNPRFRLATDAVLAEKYANDFPYQSAALGGRVDSDLQDKLKEITRLRNKAREILKDKFGSHDLFAKDNLEKLDSLAISYLQLLVALTEYDHYLSLVDPQNIEREIEKARERLAGVADSAVLEARSSQVKLLENRLERYHMAANKLELVEAQCRNVETTMKLLVDQAMTALDPKRVNRDIDQVLENIRSSETLSEELASYDDLEQELDSFGRREAE
jgi:hypothetical protein